MSREDAKNLYLARVQKFNREIEEHSKLLKEQRDEISKCEVTIPY